MDIEVSPCRQEDERAVLALADRLTVGVAPWRDAAAVARTVRSWVADALTDALSAAGRSTSPVWVARAGGEVVGFVHVGTREHWAGGVDAYVGELVVTEDLAGHGVGRLLMERAEDWAREQGHTRLTLETGHGNVGAREFYARLGYVTEEVVLSRDLTA